MKKKDGEFQFDYWAKLAVSDPDGFENARRQMIESLIDSAPEHHQPRLRGLQWQVDRTRERSSSALGSCAKISNLMWDKLLGDGGLVQQIERLTHDREPPSRGVRPATVLPFPTRN
jgi:hypothetical protein